MAKADRVIKFKAVVYGVRTMIDGGINVTLSMSANELKSVAKLLECKERSALLEIAAVPIESNKVTNAKKETNPNNSGQRRQRYPYRD